MDGKIEVLATEGKKGLITTKDGEFSSSYVYDAQGGGGNLKLAQGQVVTFKLARGNPETAVDVCPKPNGESSGAEKYRQEVRYEGFEQTAGIRSFRFQARRRGEESQEAVVTVELALFRKHGITIQEGPGLCLKFLEVELRERPFESSVIWRATLTDKEMLAHVAARAPGKKRN